MYKIQKIFLFSLFAFSPLHAQPIVSNDEAITNAILVDINAYRQKHHLAPLKIDARISKQAALHSQNMAKHQVPFGHTHFLKRVNAIRSHIKDGGAAAENVAFNYKDAHDVVKNWLLSPGHKKNIVGNYNLTGIGIARNAEGKLYFTQVFLKTGGAQTYANRAHRRPHFSFGTMFTRSVS